MTSKNQGPVYDLIVVMDRQAGVRTIPTFPSSPGLSELACCRPAILFWLFVQPMHSLHRVGFRIGCLDSFKRPTPHPLTKRGIENIFDVPVLHLGVWVSHRRFKPTHVWHHTHSLSVVVWKVASDHLIVSLERREGRGDDEQEPRSRACT